MKEPVYILAPGTKVVTHDVLDDHMLPAMLVNQKYKDARRPATPATLHGYVAGHGGDVYWAKHDDGGEAVYCFTEFELAVQPESDGGR